MVTLVRSVWSGIALSGGGVSTLAFEDPVDDAGAITMLGWVHDFWDSMKTQLDEDVTVTVEGNPSRYAASDGVLQEIFDAPEELPVTGTATGNAVPRAAQGLIRWGTAEIVNGRLLRGRTFIPGIGTALVTDTGLLTATAVTALNASADGLISDSGGVFSIWSRPIAGAGGATGLVTNASTWDQFAMLTSRRD